MFYVSSLDVNIFDRNLWEIWRCASAYVPNRYNTQKSPFMSVVCDILKIYKKRLDILIET